MWTSTAPDVRSQRQSNDMHDETKQNGMSIEAVNAGERRSKPRVDWKYFNLLFVLLLALLLDDLFGIVQFTERTTFFLTSGLYFRVLLYWGAVLSIYALSLLMLKVKSRLVSIPVLVIFTLSTIVEVSFSALNGEGLTKAFLHVIFIGPEFLLKGAATYFSLSILYAAILVTVFYLLLFKIVRNERWFGKNLSGLAAFLFIFPALAAVDVCSYSFTVSKFEKYPANMRSMHFLIEIPLKNALTIPRALTDVTTRASGEGAAADAIVLIVDESIRGDKLSLNGFEKETTPFLSKNRESVINLGIASAGSTCSHHAGMIMNSFIREDFISDRRAIESADTIFYYAKRAGFKTILLDFFNNPTRDGIRKNDLEYIDEILSITDLYPDREAYEQDFLILDELKTAMEKSAGRPLFVYIIKRGAHFPYESDYPMNEKIFHPTLEGASWERKDKEKLLNSYYNILRYSVDAFWETILAREFKGTVFIYTSDHGQNLLEYGDLKLTHCGDKKEMALVPLWLYITPDIQADFFERYDKEEILSNRNRSSHFQIFPTLLDLMNVENEGVSLFDGNPKERYFYPPRADYFSEGIRFD